MPGLTPAHAARRATDEHVGRRLKELRDARGLNQSDVGRALGLSFQQVQKYERGSNRISASVLWVLADSLKVPVGYFFEGLDGRAYPTLATQGRRGAELGRIFESMDDNSRDALLTVARTLTGVR